MGRAGIVNEKQIAAPKSPLVLALNGQITKRVFAFWMNSFLHGYTARVTSTYRDPSHNDEVGGKSNSAHVHNLAIDFVLYDAKGKALTEAQARNVFSKAAQYWPGYALFEPADNRQGYHIHLNLNRTVSIVARIGIAMAFTGVVAATAVVVVRSTRAARERRAAQGKTKGRVGRARELLPATT